MAIDYSVYYQLFGFLCNAIVIFLMIIGMIIQAVSLSKANKRIKNLESTLEELKGQNNSTNNEE